MIIPMAIFFAVAIAIIIDWSIYGSSSNRCRDIITGSIVSGLLIFGLIFGHVKLAEIKQSHWNSFKYNIVSLERDAGVESSFVLGSGIIETKQYYFFYQQIDNFNYKLHRADVAYSYIYEYDNTSDIQTPCLYEWKKSNSFNICYTIYVPQGTILQEYHA